MAGAVNFGGLASGLDTSLIIESLLVNRQKRSDAITQAISTGDAQKKALNDAKSVIGRLDTQLSTLSKTTFGNRKVTSGDDKIVTATATDKSSLGDHEITVNNLASRSVVTIGKAQSSASAVIGAGDLNLKFNNHDDINVSLSSPTSSLSDLANAINSQYKDTVQASVVEVTTGSFQLVLSSKDTGADLNIKDETDGASSSTITGFGSGFLDATQTNSGGITRTQAGENAEIVLDGITLQRSKNQIEDVLEGVTLTLKGESTGAPTSLKIDTDFEEVTKQVDEFVKGYNDILSKITSLTGEDGELKGDTDLRGLRNRLQSQITRFIPNIDAFNIREDGSTGFTSLSQIGFKSDSKTGAITFDKTKFKENLEAHFDEISTLFNGKSESDNSDFSIVANSGASFSGSIAIDGLNNTAVIDGVSYDLSRSNDVLTFAKGSKYEGISIFDASGGTGSANIKVTAGVSAILRDDTERFSSFSGVLADRVSNLDTHKRALEKQLDDSTARLESERTRLTAVFAKSEQAINTLKGLQSSLGAQSQISF